MGEFLRDVTFYLRRDASLDKIVGTSGVSRAPVIQPLLFLLFLNDLATTMRPPSFFFAKEVNTVDSFGRDDPGRDNASAVNWAKHGICHPPRENVACLKETERAAVARKYSLLTANKLKDLEIQVNPNFSERLLRKPGVAYKLTSALSC